MKAILIQRTGKPVAPNVEYIERFDGAPIGAPRAGEAVVRTLAAALNHLDLWVGMGVPGMNLAYPRVSGSDACGVVEAVGDGVDKAWVGRRVIVNAAIPAAIPPSPDDPPGSALAPAYELIGE